MSPVCLRNLSMALRKLPGDAAATRANIQVRGYPRARPYNSAPWVVYGSQVIGCPHVHDRAIVHHGWCVWEGLVLGEEWVVWEDLGELCCLCAPWVCLGCGWALGAPGWGNEWGVQERGRG